MGASRHTAPSFVARVVQKRAAASGAWNEAPCLGQGDGDGRHAALDGPVLPSVSQRGVEVMRVDQRGSPQQHVGGRRLRTHMDGPGGRRTGLADSPSKVAPGRKSVKPGGKLRARRNDYFPHVPGRRSTAEGCQPVYTAPQAQS